MENKEEKMTLEEYQKKYSKPYNVKVIKTWLFVAYAVIALIIIFCLCSLVLQIYETFDKNVISLYVSIPIAVLVFVGIYVIPLIRIQRLKPFKTQNVSNTNLKEVKKYNKELREKIADQIIDIQSKVGNSDWYNEQAVGKLAIARHTHDDAALRNELTNLYNNDIKKASHKIIRDKSLQVGLYTALSPSDKLDTAIVLANNTKLIKDIFYLYGFRPNDRELMKVYYQIVTNALLSYGLSKANLGGKILEGVPFVGPILDALIQGLTNGGFTAFLGFQAQKYLMKEYRLQDILEDVVVEDENEVNVIISDIKADITKELKHSRARA